MRVNFKRMIAALAAVVILATGVAFGSSPAASHESPAYLSNRASTLLAEIQDEAAMLRVNADILEAIARNHQVSWQSHALYLERVKDHINAVGERTAELQQMRDSVLPWQQQAITAVTAHAVQIATSTQAAITYMNENRRQLFVPEYRDHVATIADHSEDMKRAVDSYLDYQNAQQKFQELQNRLELTSE